MPNFCSNCGRAGSVDGAFCRFCGERFPAAGQAVETAAAPAAAAAPATEGSVSAIEVLPAARRYEYSLTGSRRYEADEPEPRGLFRTLAPFAVVVLAIYLLVRFMTAAGAGGATNTVVRHAFSQPVGPAAIAVAPMSMQIVEVDVHAVPFMYAYLGGYFEAEGGSGNDIQVMLVNSDGIIDLRNGHSASAFYNSGKTTIDHPHAGPLPAGTYYLVFSNKFSLITNKAVDNHLEIDYTPE